ncbi:MAG TPA: riboflavin synthase [Spirochaetota bacterium]|nr:riboflavin synthase [Spirochaetota bacterium]
MFTGIVEKMGEIREIRISDGREFKVAVDFAKELELGDSVSIDGVCHTVTGKSADLFTFFSAKETLEITNLSEKEVGDFVNLERSLQLGDRLDGHFVYGHVDMTTRVTDIEKGEESHLYTFALTDNLQKYIVPKGSVAVNGTSLTVYEKGDDYFKIMIIPHTFLNTNFKYFIKGTQVNLEFDYIGKYIENFVKAQT